MDTTDICRVCMEDDGDTFSSLFISTTGCTVTPSVMMIDCAGIAVDKSDGLPEMVCSECLSSLKVAYKIREKCRKTDRKLRKILNLVHKNQITLNPASNSDEKAGCEVIPGNINISEQSPLNEESDLLEEPALDIKSELQITSPSMREELYDLPNLDQADSEANYPTAESPDPSSNQETVGSTHTNPELTESPLILVKQEEVQQTVPINKQKYLVEETSEPAAYSKHSKASTKEYEDKHAEEDTYFPSNCNEGSNNDEEQSVNMEVEVLEDDEYEDYEAIDEDFETGDFDAASSLIESSVCCGCSMEFRTRAELDDHSKSIHLPEKDKDTALQDWYMCNICFKKHSSLKALNYHKTNRVNRRMRTCNCCKLVLNSVRKKRHHEQLHKLLPEDFEINCCGCDQVVPFKQLGSHAEQIHKNTNQPNVSRFICEVCFLDCGFKQRLDNHQSKQDIPQVVVRKQTQPEDKFTAPVADIDGKQRFICDICEKNFSTKGNLKSHRSLHGASDKPFKCAVCEKDFSKKSNYNVHMLRAHSVESSFPCSECNKSFKCATNLKTHMRVHTKEKPYRCEFCQKAFGYLSDKRRHEIGHSGNYPYKCSLCGKPYTRKTLLNRHFKSCRKRVGKTTVTEIKAEVLDQPGEDVTDFKTKPMLTCDLCDDWFSTMEELADHHADIHIQTLDEGTYDAEVEIE
ncbi:zinc finger protein 229-like [Ochlerotatus camptorhynchus]|uniref:zinc finger protein 229-like n=1 Tax=Ochlerotatus camptorhynchus TaxID=644619 RepID=UPI0031D311AD